MLELHPRHTNGASVDGSESGVWQLNIPAGPAGKYRLSQIDDYIHQKRREFIWEAPVSLELEAKVSTQNQAGTWGFGFWNDPFTASLGIKGTIHRLPSLPNTAWFFYASPENYLALHDNHPAQGMLAATFSAPLLPSILLAFGVPFAPLLAWRPSARVLRKIIRLFVSEASAKLDLDLTIWHHYAVAVTTEKVVFRLDHKTCFETEVVPRGKWGLVIWIDNQYAAFRPDGAVRMGALETKEPARLSLRDMHVS